MDINEFYAEYKDHQRKLEIQFPSGTLHLTSIEKRKIKAVGGRVCVATIPTAAMMLTKETHRVSTESEVEAWELQQENAGKDLRAKQAKKETNGMSDVAKGLSSLVDKLAFGSQQQPPPLGTQN